MAHLAISLLGPPRVEIDGSQVEFDTRKATALLAYLALSPEPHRRDALSVMLWPEYDESHAQASLRRTLSTAKKGLGGRWLIADRATVSLDRTDLAVDVTRFRELLAECATHGHALLEPCNRCVFLLERAVAFWRGDFLSGFSLRDSLPFDNWHLFEAETLRTELHSALQELSRGHAQKGSWQPAIEHARRWVSLDLLSESANQSLMSMYARSGRRSDAVRQYRAFVKVLNEELGVAPLRETTDLYQMIVKGDLAGSSSGGPDGFAVSAMPSNRSQNKPPSRTPFVDRDKELEVLVRCHGAADTDDHLVVVTGEAGIGKSRLVEEFLAIAGPKEVSVIRIQCHEGESDLAFGPLVEALRITLADAEFRPFLEAVPDHWMSELSRLLPEFAEGRAISMPEPVQGPGARARLFEAIAQVITGACARSPAGILVVEDLQWADDSTARFISYFTARLRRQPILVIVAWRTNDSSRQDLDRLLVRSAGSVTELNLKRLDENAVGELVNAAGIPEWSSEVTDLLYRESEGLPFFVEAYLRTALDSPDILRENDLPLPGDVRDLIRARVAPISETALQVLGAGAVIGRSFDFTLLRNTSGRGEEEILRSLEELVAHGLVAEHDVGSSTTYDFAHEKIRAFVYGDMSLARRRVLHRRVAHELVSNSESKLHPGSNWGLIAHHYRLGGDEGKAAEVFERAGTEARLLGANREALQHHEVALALNHPDTPGLQESIGDLQTLLGNYDAAVVAYEATAALVPTDRLAEIEHKIGNVYHRRGLWKEARSHFDEAAWLLGGRGDDIARANLLADWALTVHHSGDPDSALELAQESLNLAGREGDDLALAQAHNILGILEGSRGRSNEGRSHLEQSRALAEKAGVKSAQVAAMNNLALTLRADGNPEKALAVTEAGLELCMAIGDVHREAALHNNVADLLHSLGRPEDAMVHLKKAVSLFGEIDRPGEMQPAIWKLVEW